MSTGHGEPTYDYDAFATYATDPDGALIRAVEAFVEGFHRRPALPHRFRLKLELCVDGRDFRIPRRSRTPSNAIEEVSDIVEGYMRRCRSLVVFSGRGSADHRWIDHEIRWWREHRKNDPIYFALTHGTIDASSQKTVLELMPPALRETGGGDVRIFFDLRGFHHRRSRFSFFRDRYRVGKLLDPESVGSCLDEREAF